MRGFVTIARNSCMQGQGIAQAAEPSASPVILLAARRLKRRVAPVGVDEDIGVDGDHSCPARRTGRGYRPSSRPAVPAAGRVLRPSPGANETELSASFRQERGAGPLRSGSEGSCLREPRPCAPRAGPDRRYRQSFSWGPSILQL